MGYCLIRVACTFPFMKRRSGTLGPVSDFRDGRQQVGGLGYDPGPLSLMVYLLGHLPLDGRHD